jgi:uncharacterized protein YbjQ (UPF0145 family)
VRIPGTPPGTPPVLTDLSVPDYTKLVLSGYQPVGIVAASTVYYIVASWATRRAQQGWFSRWNNQELTDFTQGVYTARELALSKITQQAAALGAEGVVGVDIDHHVRIHTVGSDSNEREDLIITFHVIGTAIRGSGGVTLPIQTTISQGAR